MYESIFQTLSSFDIDYIHWDHDAKQALYRQKNWEYELAFSIKMEQNHLCLICDVTYLRGHSRQCRERIVYFAEQVLAEFSLSDPDHHYYYTVRETRVLNEDVQLELRKYSVLKGLCYASILPLSAGFLTPFSFLLSVPLLFYAFTHYSSIQKKYKEAEHLAYLLNRYIPDEIKDERNPIDVADEHMRSSYNDLERYFPYFMKAYQLNAYSFQEVQVKAKNRRKFVLQTKHNLMKAETVCWGQTIQGLLLFRGKPFLEFQFNLEDQTFSKWEASVSDPLCTKCLGAFTHLIIQKHADVSIHRCQTADTLIRKLKMMADVNELSDEERVLLDEKTRCWQEDIKRSDAQFDDVRRRILSEIQETMLSM